MKKIIPKNNNSSQAGFTLVELMVSLTLFIIVVVALIGSLYTVNDASRKVQAMRTVMDNVNFAMESIARNVRTSENITCGSRANCPIATSDGAQSISMNSTIGQRRFVEYRIHTQNGKGVLQNRSVGLKKDGSQNPNDSRGWVAITAPEIDIQDFKFYVEGVGNDGKQPSVIVKFEGVASVPGSTTVPFSIQTYLSQRTPESN